MKKIQRLQFILSPVLIAILSVLLVVVSFSWYQVQSNLDIEVEDVSVSITVNEPEGLDVSLKLIGDSYSYSSGTYTVTNYGPSSVVGYYGQTAEYPVDSSNNDKPYIAFFEVDVIGSVTSAYIHSLQIKLGNEILLDTIEWASEEESEFRVKFYTSLDEGRTLSEESSTITLNEGKTYMGIHFYNPNADKFEYSDIKYYGAVYSLGITFVE